MIMHGEAYSAPSGHLAGLGEVRMETARERKGTEGKEWKGEER